MVDFKNGAVIKLSKTKNFVHEDVVRPLFISDEEFIGSIRQSEIMLFLQTNASSL